MLIKSCRNKEEYDEMHAFVCFVPVSKVRARQTCSHETPPGVTEIMFELSLSMYSHVSVRTGRRRGSVSDSLVRAAAECVRLDQNQVQPLLRLVWTNLARGTLTCRICPVQFNLSHKPRTP